MYSYTCSCFRFKVSNVQVKMLINFFKTNYETLKPRETVSTIISGSLHGHLCVCHYNSLSPNTALLVALTTSERFVPFPLDIIILVKILVCC